MERVISTTSIIDAATQRDGEPLESRRASAFVIVALCKEDKEQLNRIEQMLAQLTGKQAGA